MTRHCCVLFALIAIAWPARLPADEAIASRMQQFAAGNTISGAVTLVARAGKVVSLDAIGLANIEQQRAMRDDTIFWIASMTKPITATAVMILQDEGKLSVDDAVGKYLPEFNEVKLAGGRTPARPVTIRDLLTHTSGVANPPAEMEKGNLTLAQRVTGIAKQPLQFEPGSQWKYGVGLTVAGRIVEVVTGSAFEDFVDARICKPLNMVDTTFYPTPEQRRRLATIYGVNKESKQLEPSGPTFVNADGKQPRRAPNPSGGMCSTAPDYFRFLQMVLNGGELEGKRIVSAAAVKQMTSMQTGDMKAGFVAGSAWGLGWGIVREPTGATSMLSPGTYGHGGAFGTQAWVDPQKQTVMILMIQRTGLPNSDESNVRAAFQNAAAERLK